MIDVTHNLVLTIKSSVSVRDICDREGIAVNRSGFALCPFHQEDTASMKVYSDPQRGFHCFGCGATGDVIDFAMRLYQLNYKQAIRHLNEQFHLGLFSGRPWRKGQRVNAGIRQRDRERHEAALKAAQEAYWRAFDDWLEIDRAIEEDAPQGPFEPFTDRFASALSRRAEAEYLLDAARDELSLLEGKHS